MLRFDDTLMNAYFKQSICFVTEILCDFEQLHVFYSQFCGNISTMQCVESIVIAFLYNIEYGFHFSISFAIKIYTSTYTIYCYKDCFQLSSDLFVPKFCARIGLRYQRVIHRESIPM